MQLCDKVIHQGIRKTGYTRLSATLPDSVLLTCKRDNMELELEGQSVESIPRQGLRPYNQKDVE